MDPIALLPFIVLIGAMFLMTRSAKKKQRQAVEMRDQMQPGTGVRTIGGMYASVKEVREDTVLLELAPGVHALYAKNAVGAVLEAEEFERIVNDTQDSDLDVDGTVVPDDASALTGDTSGADDQVELDKKSGAPREEAEDDGEDAPESQSKDAQSKDAKRDGDSDAK
ncbi:preprotein translocase subunit YajC [Streptomyces sp. AJS327]|uniref:preprotein translocase subunit YajC n=1 Tax=Streptomyces sp. AJS327 TaxID=2545265 RepID=UPI0015DDE6FD|nr:preprotein translocase subunit YajC [Streptomyces sp. AJS327]MBA0050794.1 preprotein translocase subunit YajC [Streptomyces sp. AJS327]